MFYEASRFGCSKMILYSCTISGMSREMMKMDGRDSAEYQIWEKKDEMVIFEIYLSHKMTK